MSPELTEDIPKKEESGEVEHTGASAIDFIHDFLVTDKWESRPDHYVANHPDVKGRQLATDAFNGDLFIGELTDEMVAKIKDLLGVDINSRTGIKPIPALDGDGEHVGWISDRTGDDGLVILRRDMGDKTELLAFQKELAEVIFKEKITLADG